jgi:antitoxin CptB
MLDPATRPAPSSPPASEALGTRELGRLRWRCRRGMLENDLILARFLDRHGPALTAAQVVALDRLLDLGDDVLWDVLAGRVEPDDPAVRPLVDQLRGI